MTRVARRFSELRSSRRRALIPFITAGDPAPAVTVPLMRALVTAGADLLELGVPFSDPMADGPVIARAGERALAHRTNLPRIFEMVEAFRRDDTTTPVILMGYMNPIETFGYETFAAAASRAGVDGVLTVDLPPEEAGDLMPLLRGHDLDPIFLLAPTTGDERIRTICEHASGFVYYVAVKGVTGTTGPDPDAVAANVARIRAVTDLPVGVGFGISDAASAARIARFSDAVIVGSALVRIVEGLRNEPDRIPGSVSALVAEIRAAMDIAGETPGS